MNTNTGGSAFPVAAISQNAGTGETTVHQSDGGMTLRDYFAAKALGGMMASETEDSQFDPKIAAERAYRMADALLAAREA